MVRDGGTSRAVEPYPYLEIELSLENVQWASAQVPVCDSWIAGGSRWPELQGALGGRRRRGKSGREDSGQGSARLVLEKAGLGTMH